MFFIFITIITLILWIIIGTAYLKLHPFLVLFTASILLGLSLEIHLVELLKLLFVGFSDTIQKIGLLIIFGTIIGKTLELTNATSSIANHIIMRFRKMPLQFKIGFIGYIISIPVFCDAAFIILSKTIKSISKKSKIPLKSLGVALSTGLFAPHVLVPPTPGPLAAASNLKLEDFSLLIIIGSVLALILVIIGSAFSYLIYNKSKFNANLFFYQKSSKKFPSLSESIIPIIVPVILIAIGTLFGNLNAFKNLDFVFSFLRNPSFALVVGVVLSFRLIKFNPEIGLNFCIKVPVVWYFKAFLAEIPVISETIQKYESFVWDTVIEPTPIDKIVQILSISLSRPNEAKRGYIIVEVVIIATVDEPWTVLNIEDIRNGIKRTKLKSKE